MILILTLTSGAAAVAAQETATAPETAEPVIVSPEETVQEPEETVTTEAATEPIVEDEQPERSAQELRPEFISLLQQHPYSVATILAYDPALLNNAQFLERYPEIASFVQENPEITRNPSFYMAPFRERTFRDSTLEEVLEPIMIFSVFLLIAYALSWLFRTVIEQKRWNRLFQSQTEVHNKILDRFGTSNELLDYIKTPAGSKFLEAAPIPLHSEESARNPQNPQNPPLTRIMWLIQIGVVVAIGSLGMLLVSLRVPEQAGDELFVFGLIAFCVGAGFIGSAAVTLIMSQRLGLWTLPDRSAPSDRSTDPGTVR